MIPTLDSIRSCLDGAAPALIATCAIDGTPNVANLSQVQFVDNRHVALSFQFFNKTRENILANPYAMVQVVDPVTGTCYSMRVRYLRTESSGPLFETMRAKLAGIASHTGMSKIFRLRGSDVYQVLDLSMVPGSAPPEENTPSDKLAALRQCTRQLAACMDFESAMDTLLDCLQSHFGIQHSMLLMMDEQGQKLYTVASRGYDASGVGSEIRMGDGIIGVAAGEGTAIRISHMAEDYLYSQAVRQQAGEDDIETCIPFPGLAESNSQLAVPLVVADKVNGVLYVESPESRSFCYEHEDALGALVDQLAVMINIAGHEQEAIRESNASKAEKRVTTSDKAMTVRYFPADHSVFIDDDYLIKGVAGAIFWKLMRSYVDENRIEFTNRELRIDSSLGLPEISDNLEARLILLQRRLAERFSRLAIEKSGRGRFCLRVGGPVTLKLQT